MLALAILLLAPGDVTGIEVPAERIGTIAASLRVVIGEQPVSPGRGQARYVITIEGPGSLEIGPARLEDAFAAWRVGRQSSSWSADVAVRIERTLWLVQVKPGVVPLPGVRLQV